MEAELTVALGSGEGDWNRRRASSVMWDGVSLGGFLCDVI